MEVHNAIAERMELDMDTKPSVYDLVLKNQRIVDKLCSFVSLNDMKNMRYVCCHWKEQVAPVLFSRAWLPLMSEENDDDWDVMSLSRFMRAADALPNLKLIKQFTLKYMNLTDASTEKTDITRFFKKHGEHIKRLALNRCRLDKTGEFWTNLVRISKWTNELQELILDENCFIQTDTPSDSWGLPSRHKIRKLEFFSDKSEGALPCAPGEIWKEFPILETLRLVDLTEEENLVLLESMNPGKFQNSQPPLILRELDMFGKMEDSVHKIPRNQGKLFCELKLPLTKLKIDIGVEILSGNFQQLLRAYCTTLKELVIWRGSWGNQLEPPGFPFGVTLPALEFLEVPESCIVNFNFIHYLPKLNRLTIRQCDHYPISRETNLFSFRYSYKEWRTFLHEPCKTVRDLKIEFKVSDENMEFLRGIFPNLRTFAAFLGGNQWKLVTF